MNHLKDTMMLLKRILQRNKLRGCELDSCGLGLVPVSGACERYSEASWQGRIKGFLGSRHFSSLGPLGDSKIIVGTTVYCRLSGLMEGKGTHG
jgi:hypothetical protein